MDERERLQIGYKIAKMGLKLADLRLKKLDVTSKEELAQIGQKIEKQEAKSQKAYLDALEKMNAPMILQNLINSKEFDKVMRDTITNAMTESGKDKCPGNEVSFRTRDKLYAFELKRLGLQSEVANLHDEFRLFFKENFELKEINERCSSCCMERPKLYLCEDSYYCCADCAFYGISKDFHQTMEKVAKK